MKRAHAGVPLANGTLGLLVWGSARELRVTIARQGFWHHGGGNPALSRTDFATVRRLLEANDAAGIEEVFGKHHGMWGQHPRQIGGGRLTLRLPAAWAWDEAWIQRDGSVRIRAGGPRRAQAVCTLRVAADRELAWLDLPPALATVVKPSLAPAAHLAGESYEKYGFPAPETWSGRDRWGFLQRLPADPALGVAARRVGTGVQIATALGVSDRAGVDALLAEVTPPPAAAAKRWWTQFWREVPRIRLPEAGLQEAVEFGLHKLACCTPPQGQPCALQGPLMEDQQLPPWSNDYHFNINVQMIHLPVLAANRPDHLNPMWDLLRAQLPRLAEQGRKFFGDPEALLLPHACDDRGQVIGSFWTGSIDHGCTAWMALLAWWHHAYTGDTALLRDLAWPLLRGAFAGYWAMLDDDGRGGLRLPVSVSPEFRGSAMNAWGVNASFQLAALHATVQALRQAAVRLGQSADPRWDEVERRVPPYAQVEGPHFIEWQGKPEPRIGLWQGQDLDFSHRHHSHLAGIWPFMSFDPADPAHAGIVANSIHRWTLIGPGGWSGWCVPWAATLMARLGHPDAWLRWMHHWQDVFVNEGRGTLHDAAFFGGGCLYAKNFHHLPMDSDPSEIFQLDAGMGALTAVFELLVQQRGEVLHLLPAGLPMRWRDLSFDGIRCPGAVLAGATVEDGRLRSVRLTSLNGGPVNVVHGLERDAQGNVAPRPVVKKTLKAGETWTWTAK